MPIFEYYCDKCDHNFDKLVVSRDAEVTCPMCQGKVKKLMSTFSYAVHDNFSHPADRQPQSMCRSCG